MPERLSLRLRQLGPALLRAALPAACALCGGRCAGALCAPCRAEYLGLRRPRCRQCANPLADAAAPLCGRCLADPPAFDATLVAADYAAPVDQLLLQLKFGARLALAPLFAQLLRDAVLERPELALPALLCPVPLGPARLAERGFNQALEIARPLARALGVALHPTLAARARETRAQTRLAPRERAANLRLAFVVDAAVPLRGRHVGVVDDVITSGRTLDELAATLKRCGAARVTNLVFARTPPH
ncbi:ComF family protein [Janthinobacterium sp.]|uniref:ComF family protein n=1 Tax=Janthinobacterium sp. TaxID=1871054 RepID=UPI00293D5DE9|nr:ComF family protein [Janthinobacterium sp.]